MAKPRNIPKEDEMGQVCYLCPLCGEFWWGPKKTPRTHRVMMSARVDYHPLCWSRVKSAHQLGEKIPHRISDETVRRYPLEPEDWKK